MSFGLGFWAAAGAAAGPTDYELISTTLVGTATSLVSFTSIPQTYKHLQIRITARSSLSSSYDNLSYYFNSDTGSNYSTHALYGTGSSVVSNSFTTNVRAYWPSLLVANTNVSNNFSGGVIDILDYASSSKNKTTRTLMGDASPGFVALISSRWGSSSAITRIDFETSANIMANSRFSLFGIKG